MWWIYESRIFLPRNEEVNAENILTVKDATYAFMKRKLGKNSNHSLVFLPHATDTEAVNPRILSTWSVSMFYLLTCQRKNWAEAKDYPAFLEGFLMEALRPHVIPLTESQFTRSAEAYNACSHRTFAFSARTKAPLTETNLSHTKS